MTHRWQRVLLWVATLALGAAIFAFSAQPGPESDDMTAAAVTPLIDLFLDANGSGEDAWQRAYLIAATLVRKAAHLAEYALLGLLLALLARAYGLQMRWLPLLIGVAYAATDELHQHFVPGRLGAVTDVLIDTIGVVAGVYAAGFISHIRRKKHVHDP